MTDGQGEAPDPRGVERLRKQLDRMADRGESAQEKQRSAEKLREQAERMLDGASSEEREQLEELAREMAREGDGGEPGSGAGAGPKRAEGAQPTPDRAWDTEDVDARGELSGEPDDDGRVIAEWFGKDNEQPDGAASSGQGTGAGSVVDEAAKGAEPRRRASGRPARPPGAHPAGVRAVQTACGRARVERAFRPVRRRLVTRGV
ncbi:MAG: hypothetical protein HND58_08140 [Planctomycetota bacterium]|nr:MAG: hypothetical protein HND58_08140 [Planctomycetota bacterium]